MNKFIIKSYKPFPQSFSERLLWCILYSGSQWRGSKSGSQFPQPQHSVPLWPEIVWVISVTINSEVFPTLDEVSHTAGWTSPDWAKKPPRVNRKILSSFVFVLNELNFTIAEILYSFLKVGIVVRRLPPEIVKSTTECNIKADIIWFTWDYDYLNMVIPQEHSSPSTQVHGCYFGLF